jgi:arabinogalactan endo-1,4-beta-galactosidase
MRTLIKIIVAALIPCCYTQCKKGNASITPPPPTIVFAKGADISWLTEMEAAGKKFYNSSGAEQECMSLLKSLGVNTIRLRVWVNPAGTGTIALM